MGRDAKRVARQDNRRLRRVGGGCATRLTRFCAGHVEKCACNERLAHTNPQSDAEQRARSDGGHSFEQLAVARSGDHN